MSKVHKRIVYHGVIKIPSKALCGAPGMRTSADSLVTCLACHKLMAKAAVKASNSPSFTDPNQDEGEFG